MDSFQITISDWAAFSPCRSQREAWQAWANGGEQSPAEEACKPDLPWVNAMLRRRLSPMGRAALWAAGQLLGDGRDEPVASIFASRHGEVGRTVKLLRDLAAQAPVSPASFSLSVHNAIGGIHSIANKVTSPISAISAGPDTVCAALLEAYTQLAVGPDPAGEVLCVFYDDPLPVPLDGFDREQHDVQALAVRVTLSDQAPGIPLAFSLEQHSEGAESPPGKDLAHADQFLRFLLRDEASTLALSADQRTWRWRKLTRTSA